MISYEVYKILHLIFILLTIATIALSFSNQALKNKNIYRIVLGIFVFFIFVAGMGLVARIGLKHSDSFPLWIKTKIGLYAIFAFLAVEHILEISKNTFFRKYSYLILASIVIVAIKTAIYK